MPYLNRRLRQSFCFSTPPYTRNLFDHQEIVVKNYGYRLDIHLVASETGHILTLHRLSRGKRDGRSGRPVAFIHHGLLGSSDMWLLRGPKYDLPYLLHEAGYDVWLFNARGNCHSRKHKTLNPDRDKKYWEFGVEEIGYYDLPATIDYILNITNEKQIFFIGHSLGCSAAFIACSMKPKYNDKIRLILALGPLANVKHPLSTFHQVLFATADSLLREAMKENIYELMPRRAYISKITEFVCGKESPTQQFCLSSIFSIVGEDFSELNTTEFAKFVHYYPSGTSTVLLLDILTYYLKGSFARPDRGSILMNTLHYNATKPPSYDLSKVTTPVSLHYGPGDFVVTEEDIIDLSQRLPNVVGKFKVPHDYFNHLDFVMAINARTLLYEKLLKIMSKYR